MSSGVYQYIFSDGSRYIGSAVNLRRRHREHICDLNAKKHYNKKFQDKFNELGLFLYEVLIICAKEEVRFYEKIAMSFFEPDLNQTTAAGGIDYTDELRAKISKTWTLERKSKTSAAMKGNKRCLGRKDSAETNARKSAALKGRKPSPLAILRASERMKILHRAKDKRFKNYV